MAKKVDFRLPRNLRQVIRGKRLLNKILKICAVICGLFIIGIVWKFDDIVAYWGNKQTTENDDKEKYLISAFHNKYWEAEIEATKQRQTMSIRMIQKKLKN